MNPPPPERQGVLTVFALWLVGAWLDEQRALQLQIKCAEVDALKRQLAELGHRPRLTWSERLTISKIGQRLGKKGLRELATLFKAETILGWVKAWQRKQANARKRPGTARRKLSPEARKMIPRLYDEGFTTLRGIEGELKKLGLVGSHTTIAQELKRTGRTPDPSSDSWPEFLRRHAHLILAVDFLQVPVGLFGKVVNQYLLVGIEHDTRRAHLLGMTPHPTADFMRQVAINATAMGGALDNRRILLRDNDQLYPEVFDTILADAGVATKRTAICAPDMNAFAERFIRSIKEECLDKFIFLHERMLHRAAVEYIRHYNERRPHQSLGNRPIGEWEATTEGEVVIDSSLGGLLKSARRAA